MGSEKAVLTNGPLKKDIIKSKMHTLLQKQSVARWIKLGKLTTLTGITQVGIQALGFIGGILVIRLLSTNEYALYILANTMLGAMTVLSDGGISSGVMAEGGKVWGDKKKLGAVISTGLFLRRQFALGSLILIIPVLLYFLRHHGADWGNAILILFALIPAFFAALSGRILEIAPKLHQDIGRLQRIHLLSNAGRLGLLGLTIFVFPFAFVAICAASAAQIWANLQLRKRAEKFIHTQAVKSREVQRRIINLVKRTMPGAIYYTLAGQLTIWLVSIFGNTENIAQIGALGRLAAVLAVIQSLMNILVVPYFAKIQEQKRKLIRLFLLLQVGFVLFTALLCLTVWGFPQAILSILGPQYDNLSLELLLMMLASCIALQGSAVYHISASMGIVPAPGWMISYMLFFQIGLVFVFDFSILSEVITYSLCLNLSTLIYQAIYFLRKIYQKDPVRLYSR